MSIYQTAIAAVSDRFIAGLTSGHGPTAQQWLDYLPTLLATVCNRWNLDLPDPTPRHGYQALIWRVERQSIPFALKVTIPSRGFSQEIAGLIAWNGRDMVQLERYDQALGVALLQWLDASVSLADVPIDEAINVVGRMLTITPSLDPRSQTLFPNSYAEAQSNVRSWAVPHQNSPIESLSPAAIRGGKAALKRVAAQQDDTPIRLVNHDLHYENVIRDWNGNWVCIDPKPMAGPPEYALAPLIWRRFHDPSESIERVLCLCDIANLNAAFALDWLLIRAIDYFVWSVGVGLTSDPEICKNLINQLIENEGESSPGSVIG